MTQRTSVSQSNTTGIITHSYIKRKEILREPGYKIENEKPPKNNPLTMSVVNCKVAFLRPRYQNLQEWINDPNNVYVGRAGIVFIENQRFPKQGSEWANPFKIGKLTRDEVLVLYEQWIRQKIKKEGTQGLLALKGKTLGCWCAPEPCHADILLKLIQEFS